MSRGSRITLPPPRSLEGTSRELIIEVLGPPAPCFRWEVQEESMDRCASYEFNELTEAADGNVTLEVNYRSDRCSAARWIFGYVSPKDGWRREEFALP